MTDFTYTQDGLFTTIIPETPKAERAWNETIAPKTDGTGKVLTIHFESVKSQLKAAGYTIRKAAKISPRNDKMLLFLLTHC